MIGQSFRRFSGTILLSGIGIAIVVVSSLVFLRMGGSHQGVTSSPRLVLGPNPVSPGSVVTVSGFDFPESQPVKVYFQDPSHDVVNTTVNAGGFFNADMKLPDQINDGSRVYAVSGSVTSFIPLHIMKPLLTALYNPLSQDGTAVINGKGFLANSSVTLTLSHGSSRIHKSTVRANQLGQIQSSVVVSDMQGTLVASDSKHNTASINLNVPPPPTRNTISRVKFSSLGGAPGKSINVSGGSFPAGDTVSIALDSSRSASTAIKSLASATATNGTINTSFSVPTLPRGTYTIVVIDQNTGKSTVYKFSIL
jgi:hypothetical protein